MLIFLNNYCYIGIYRELDYGIETVSIANLSSMQMRISAHIKTILDRMQPLPDETSSLSLHDMDSDTDDEEMDYPVTCLFSPRVPNSIQIYRQIF